MHQSCYRNKCFHFPGYQLLFDNIFLLADNLSFDQNTSYQLRYKICRPILAVSQYIFGVLILPHQIFLFVHTPMLNPNAHRNNREWSPVFFSGSLQLLHISFDIL